MPVLVMFTVHGVTTLVNVRNNNYGDLVMNKIVSAITLVALLGSLGLNSMAADKDYWSDETPKDRTKRLEWWNEARFGMFIHWGLYAVPAGEWQGNKNHAEWIRTTAKIPVETYNKFVGEFNPVKFDADAWVKMAKQAGMKYIVITSKHHDGFCLWPSEASEYDIESTPYKKDLLGPLTEACKKYDVRMCFYHSVMDWHHPDYLPRRGWEKADRPNGDADFDKYVTYMKAQLKELVDTYNPGVMWFDGEWEGTWTHERGIDLYQYMRELDEDIIVNNRVDKGRRGMEGLTKSGEYRGDFGTPEQRIPAKGLPGVDWESCMTMNSKWGWNSADKRWKPSKELIQKLADIASKGGNFLLNIGPKPDGTFPQKAIDRLADIGKWMDINSESIYGTQASPFDLFDWGRCTQKKIKFGNTRLYLHVFEWPASGEISIPISNKAKRAYLLASPDTKLTVEKGEFNLTISLPEIAPDKADSVIVLDIKGEPIVNEVLIEQNSAGVIKLNADDAELSGGLHLEEKGGKSNIGFWLDAKSLVEWTVMVKTSGEFTAKMEMAAEGNANLNLSVAPKSGKETSKTSVTLEKTGGYDKFKTVTVGTVNIEKPGIYKISLRPNPKAWNPINVRQVTLIPQ